MFLGKTRTVLCRGSLSGLVIGEDQALGEMVGMGPITKVPPGPLSTVDAGPLKQTASKVDPVKTAQEIRHRKFLQICA